jgi:MFS family permease
MKSGKTGSEKAVFFSLCLMGTLLILSSTMSKSGSVLSTFSKSLGTPDEWTGIVLVASTIPGILISLPAASLSDVFGRKRFLLLAALIFASAPFLYLFINDWRQLVLVRFYHGFATAIFIPVAEASVAELFPQRRGERISLFTSATYVGRIIAPTLGGYLLFATNYNFQQVYLAVAVAGVTGFITALPFLARREHKADTSPRPTGSSSKAMFSGWLKIASNKGALIVSLIQAGQYYAFGAYDFYRAEYMIFGLGYTTLSQGLIASSVLTMAIFTRPVMGRLSDRIGRRTPIILGCILAALALITVPFVANFAILLVLLAVCGFGFASTTSSTSALISELVPQEFVGTSMGFLDTTMDIGQTIGGFVSGIMFATTLHYSGVFLSFAVVLMSSCAIFAFSGVGKKKTRPLEKVKLDQISQD